MNKVSACEWCGRTFAVTRNRNRKYCDHVCAGYGKARPVKIITKDGEELYFRSVSQAAEALFYEIVTVQKWITGHNKSAAGYRAEHISMSEYERCKNGV